MDGADWSQLKGKRVWKAILHGCLPLPDLGQGFATEFVRAMIPYGFTHFPLTRIFATADHRNTASIRVMQKIGMVFVCSDERGVEYEIRPSAFEAHKYHRK